MSVQKISLKGSENMVASNAASGTELLELRKSYTIGSSVRGITETHNIDLKDDDLVELIFNDDTTWYCNTDSIDEIFPDAPKINRSGEAVFELPITLTNTDTERGVVGSILLKGLNIFAKKAINTKVKDVASDFEKKQLENTSGLYFLDKNFQLLPFEGSQPDQHYLLFLHGTASSTKSSFGELMNSDLWNFICNSYGKNVLAFQHESLTKSPLRNVFDLIKQLPKNISFDIISHSRGGLVGDTLARFCNANENFKGFDENEIEFLKKADNRNEDLLNIEAIKNELTNRKVSVKKFIRVACPAQGTTLASNRMDHFFNVTFNLIGLAGGIFAGPAYSAFKNLISTVIDSKNEVDVLPGLEAMNPDSPFIKALNSPNSAVVLDQPLLIVSGNCKTKLNLKALLIIASKLFYQKDNDLVVNTQSMYYGSKRQARIQYLFDEATDVDHFHYFKNKNTNDGILRALKSTTDELIPGFSFFDQAAIRGLDRNALLKLDGGQVFTDTVTGTKPIVILLPGIMGSNLSGNEHSIWINYLKFLTGGLTQLDIKNNDIKASSLVSTSYKKLVEFLSSDYDVVTFPFDWRLQLNKVAATLNEKINKLLAFQQPIKVIGHSMGGVLFRDFILTFPDTWNKLNKSPGFKLLFLGAPLGGSFRIPLVLMGRDGIIEKLSKIDIFHTKKDLLTMFAKMPGLLSLLPLTTSDGEDFSDATTWTNMSAPLGKWPLPLASDLKEFQKYRDGILSSMEEIDYSNITYIAGRDTSTPCGYKVEETNRGKELVFLSTSEGDQSVTWESGIPKKMIENNSVYYANVTHGALANEASIFSGIADLIAKGFTNAITTQRPETRGGKKVFKTPEQHDFDISAEGVTNTILGLDDRTTGVQEPFQLRVSISCGDLKYASHPLLAGHFQNDGILNAEKVIDQNMKLALSEMHKLSIYPGAIGSSEIFLNESDQFNGSIIIGLGESASFTAYQLSQTVEQGVCKYLLSLGRKEAENSKASGAPVSISSLIIGSGYGGLSIENSIRSIMQGVQNANNKIKKIRTEKAKAVEFLEFVELYEDAALSAFYCLSKIENEENSGLHIRKDSPKMRKLFGSKKRIQAQLTDGWWNRITVQMEAPADATKMSRTLLFHASTGAAREQERRIKNNPELVDQIIEDMSTKNRWSEDMARTIFELLIPNDFKEQLSRQCNINWILDKKTASFPWELLQDKSAEAKPLSVNAGMIRQLATTDDRIRINTVSKNNALVIGDPFLDGYAPQLPGAFAEAEYVGATLNENSFTAKPLLRGTPAEIIKTLFADDFKIIHLAGHGMFTPDDPTTSGMVIGKGIYLTTAEIAQMSTTPELVFVNCCYLGKTDGLAEELYRSRYKLAANIGTQLIENGVKAVVVAGWAVDDAAAMEFTKIFYANMFDGANFGDAVHKARKSIYDNYHTVNNTWGAYQCYGDPFYRFDTRHKQSKSFSPNYVISEEAEIALYNLRNEINLGKYNESELYTTLIGISQAVDKAEFRNAEITVMEALIYADMYMYDEAVSKFQMVMAMEKANFSVSALEKYCNVRAKKSVIDFQQGTARSKVLKEMTSVISNLYMLLEISPTSERYSLLGSAFKRQAFIGTATQKAKALAAAAHHYYLAHISPLNNNKVYTLCNWLEMESLLVLLGNRKWGQQVSHNNSTYDLPEYEVAKNDLNQLQSQTGAILSDMDYWSMMQDVNVRLGLLFLDMASTSDDALWDALLHSYRMAWTKAGSKGNRLAEIEHLDLLADGLSQSKKRDVAALKKRIKTLKEELVKIT
ncbi:MAG: CHAT domain-containing protein [Ginsengibacter sp.]